VTDRRAARRYDAGMRWWSALAALALVSHGGCSKRPADERRAPTPVAASADAGPTAALTLLPRSHLGVDPPWLVVAAPGNPVIRLDVRLLDDVTLAGVELDDAGAVPSSAPPAIVLAAGDLEVALDVVEGAAAARQIADALRPLTRAGRTGAPPVAVGLTGLVVGTDEVVVRDEVMYVGRTAFAVEQVRALGEAGENLPLPEGEVQAALALLVIEATAARAPASPPSPRRRAAAP